MKSATIQLRAQAQPQSSKIAAEGASRSAALPRRTAVLLPLLMPLVATGAARATPSIQRNREVDNDTSPLVQDLLRRTAEKKEDRKKERLADYYRRNFSDYFTFTEGNMKDLSPETQQEIKEWLKNNGVEGVTVPQYPPPEP